MKNVTVAEIISLAKQRSDLENSNFIKPAEWLDYVNGSYAELYDLLVGVSEDYYTTTLDVTVPDGYDYIDVPSDFYKLRALDCKYGSEWLNVTQFQFNQRNRRSTIRTATNYPFKQYRLVAQKVLLVPETDAPGDYKLWYVPAYTTLTSTSDSLDGINGWEEYIVIDVAIKALVKQEQDVRDLMVAKQLMTRRIEKLAANRNNGEPESINDTQSGDDYWFNGY